MEFKKDELESFFLINFEKKNLRLRINFNKLIISKSPQSDSPKVIEF